MWAFIHFNQITKLSFFLIRETTQETPNVPLMKPIKTFHQSLTQGFDTQADELNYQSNIMRINYTACLSDMKSRQFIYFLNINSAFKALQTINICYPYGGGPVGGRG